MCMYTRASCAYVHVCGRGRSSTQLIALYVNEAVALVRITWGSTCMISSVSYVCLAQQYMAHLQIHVAPDGAFIKAYQTECQHRLSSKVNFYARVSSRVLFLYLKNRQPSLPFLSGRLTSSSDLALSRSFSVQRLFFCGDGITITSWAPDVVNLVRP